MAESDETRLARLEAARDNFAENFRILLPLPAQYAVAEERLANLRDDLNDGLKGIRDEVKDTRAEIKEVRLEIKELKADHASRARERRGYLAALFICGFGLFGNFVVQLTAPDPVPISKAATK